MMTNEERRIAELLRDRMAKIITELKLAYDDAKLLANKYDWDMSCFDMCEAYMNLAHDFIYIMAMLDEDKKGGKK